MRRAMDWMLDYVSSGSSVYAVIAGVLLLCGLGVPIPEDIPIMSAGYFAHLGMINVHVALLVCFGSVLAGDCIAFAIGRYGGRRFVDSRLGQRIFPPRKQRRIAAYFRKYDAKVVFVARFLPGLRFSIYMSAGMMRVRPWVFLTYDSLAALLSVPALVYVSYFFGEQIDDVLRWARRSEWGAVTLIAAVVGVFVLVRVIRHRRGRRRLPTGPAPIVAPPGEPPAQGS